MAPLTLSDNSPAVKILAHLQRHGEATIKELEDVLGISTTAVREHMTHLQARGLVDTRLVRRGAGRPHLAYFLTAQAQSLFPKEYDTLITMLLRELAQRGPDQLQTILDAVGARMAEEYGSKIAGGELGQRLDALRQILEARGIPTDVQPSGDGLRVFACPYLDVAQEHPAVCRMEQHMLEQVLGEKLLLEGSIREGGRSCHFSVKPPEAEEQES